MKNLKLIIYLSLITFIVIFIGCKSKEEIKQKPNILVILTDQWRADAFGYRGNQDVITPNIDKLANEGVQFVNAVSAMPVCTPARASFLTGQRALSNGVFMNDVQLDTNAVTLGKVMAANDYQTAYIGKWHLDGNGRSAFIPKSRRQGFQYWKVLECTHDYNHSLYYADKPDTMLWDDYDAFSQTDDALAYMKSHANEDKPFLLYMSYGPPHAPYQTAPEKYRRMYKADQIHLSPNVPEEMKEKVQRDFAGYYAHCTALDDMVGKLRAGLKEMELDKNTIILFLSDHGDLLGSHGYYKKQQPYSESARIPMIFYVPKELGGSTSVKEAMINAEDVMPTLLGFSGIEIPSTVEGIDYSDYILNKCTNPGDTVTLITCVQPFGQWSRINGGREYRGLISKRYTYARDLNGPWLLFDNQKDPYQLNNLINQEEYSSILKSFDELLSIKLEVTGDEFLSGLEYVKQYNYPELDKRETVPYRH